MCEQAHLHSDFLSPLPSSSHSSRGFCCLFRHRGSNQDVVFVLWLKFRNKKYVWKGGGGGGGGECKNSMTKDLNSLEYLLFTKAKILSNSQLRAKESPGIRRSLEWLDMKLYFLQEGRAQPEMKCFNRHCCPSIMRGKWLGWLTWSRPGKKFCLSNQSILCKLSKRIKELQVQ